jgi:mRNA interferase HigB
VRIIARKTLKDFWARHEDAEQPLKAWYREAKLADWATPAQLKKQFGNASLVGSDRVAFSIAGNKYQLVAAINYAYRVIYIRFVGTHRQYDRIDASEV